MGKIQEIKREVEKIIVGQEELIDSLLIGLIANGHILVEGVPGLAKTTALMPSQKPWVRFKEGFQFTPGPTPSDIVGTKDI